MAADEHSPSTTDSGASWRFVPVDSADDSADLLRRIAAEQAPRVCLVAVGPVPALHSPTVLRALRSRAAAGQITLGLSTRDQGLLGMAQAAGWETPSIDAAELEAASTTSTTSTTDRRQRSSRRPSRPPRRAAEPSPPQQERPRTAAEALAAIAAGSSARLRSARTGRRPQEATRPARRPKEVNQTPSQPQEATQTARRPQEATRPAWDSYRRAAADTTAAPVERDDPRPASASRITWRPVLVAVLTVVLLVAGVLFGLPNARVTLQTVPVAFTSDMTLIADARVRGIGVADGKLPARVVSVEASQSLEIPTTGQEAVPDRKATGEVFFTNKLSSRVVVPQGTVVQAGNVSFVTTGEVVIPGSVTTGSQQSFGVGRAKIEAVTGGTAGNVAPEAIKAVAGPLSESLVARNDEPTQGGTDREVRFVTAGDRQQLYNTLLATLREKVEARLSERERTGESLVVWPEPNPAVTEEDYEPAEVRAEANSVRLRMKVRYSATQFRGDDVNQLVNEKLAAHVDSIAPGWVVVNETLQVSPPVVERVESGGAVHMQIQARGHREPNVDVGQIRSDLAGRTRAEAQAYLDARPGFAGRELTVWPGWLNSLPRLPFRITVEKQRLGVEGA